MPPLIRSLKRLHGLEAGEISLVPQGANKKRYLIFKSAGEKMPEHKQLLDLISKADPEVMQRVDERLKQHAAQFGAEQPMNPPEEKPVQKEEMGDVAEQNEVRAVAAPLDGQSQAALKAVVRILSPFREKLPASLVHDVLDAAGFEEAEDPSEAGELYNNAPGANRVGEGYQQLGEGEMEEKMAGASFMAIPAKVESEKDDFLGEVKKGHFHEAVEKAQGMYKEHMEKLGYRKYPDAEMAMKSKDGEPVIKMKGEPVSKSANVPTGTQPQTNPQLELVLKSHKELVQKHAELEAKWQERDAQDRKKEIVQKAATFSRVALPQEDIVAQLEYAHTAGPEAYERVCKSFATLNEQARSSNLFKEFGSPLAGANSGSEDAWAKIERLADSVVQKSSDVKMTRADAMEVALASSEGQRLYAQYKDGRKDGI